VGQASVTPERIEALTESTLSSLCLLPRVIYSSDLKMEAVVYTIKFAMEIYTKATVRHDAATLVNISHLISVLPTAYTSLHFYLSAMPCTGHAFCF
jgi:hypothetical protein